MGSMSIFHWVIVLAVVAMVFGTKKLGSMGGDLGKAIKGFKDGVKDDVAGTPAAMPLPAVDGAPAPAPALGSDAAVKAVGTSV